MKGVGTTLIKRNVKMFFKDKGTFFTALITPMILLVLYATFLNNVYRNSFLQVFEAIVPGVKVDDNLLNGLVGGLLLSSLLSVSTVTVSFCANLCMVQDKVTGARSDFDVSPVKPRSIALGYYISTAIFKAVSNNNHAGPMSRYQITQTDALSYYGYYYFYKAIANVNKVLSIIDDIPHTDAETAEFNDYKGQLYAWRAMLHFDLARLYCNAPTASTDVNAANSGIVLSTEVYEPSYVAPRTTLKETYNQILEDFATALPLLSKDESNGYINYWAALALRARVNLYNGDNAAALADAQAVITGSPYKLYTMDEYTKVWIQEFTSESILEFRVTTNYNAQRNSVGYYCDSEGYGECAFVEEAPLYTYLVANPNDVRSKLIKDQTAGSEPGYYPAKYPGREGNMYVNNPKIIRLSDVYLIAAEAAFKTGGDAASYINTLRQNRIEASSLRY